MVEHGTARYSWLDNDVKTTLRQGHVACCGIVDSPRDGTVTCSGRRWGEIIHLLVVTFGGAVTFSGAFTSDGTVAYGEEEMVNYSGQGTVTSSGRETS